MLAGLGILLVLLFESFFIFELYEANLFRKKSFRSEIIIEKPEVVVPDQIPEENSVPSGAKEVVPVG